MATNVCVCDDEVKKSLAAYLSAVTSAGYKVGLYKNNHTPARGDTISSYTPADFGGYSGLVTLSSWTGPSASGSDWVYTASDVVWTANGGSSNSIYGYYVVDGSGNLAWAAALDGGPVTISVNGQTYTVSPKFGRRSLFP